MEKKKDAVSWGSSLLNAHGNGMVKIDTLVTFNIPIVYSSLIFNQIPITHIFCWWTMVQLGGPMIRLHFHSETK